MSNNIILCGFMGCGKTTVGTLLAQKCGMSFIDMDSYIEQSQGKTVSQIFEENGEDFFRDLEHNACIELAKNSNQVIATGGGALTFERNANVLKKSGTIILIDVTVEQIMHRLQNDTTRPLLMQSDKDKAILNLYQKRLPIYKSVADIVVDGNLPADDVAKNIETLTK